jgi:hypothetical protein
MLVVCWIKDGILMCKKMRQVWKKQYQQLRVQIWQQITPRYQIAGETMTNVITLENISLVDGMTIALQADTSKFWSRIDRDSNPIGAAKEALDPFCQFKVTVLPNNKITLQADNALFLSRINRGANLDPVEATKKVADVFCQFKVTVLPNNKITLQADNDLFLSRINRGANLDPIEATKKVADAFCQFKVIVITTNPAPRATIHTDSQFQAILQAQKDAEQAAKTAQQAATDAQTAQGAAETAAKAAQQVATDLLVQPPIRPTPIQSPPIQPTPSQASIVPDLPFNNDIDNWSIISGLFGIGSTLTPPTHLTTPVNQAEVNSETIPLARN